MKKLFFTLLCLFFIFSPLIVFSANETQVSFDNPAPIFSNKSASEIVGLIIKSLLGILGSAALCIFIYAGFIWMTAKGNSGKIKEATNLMLYTSVGIAVIFFSYSMLRFVFDVIK